MQLTKEQNDYIQKQYIKHLDRKLSLDATNKRLQDYFNLPHLDFRPVIKDCKQQNKGYYDIGWFLYDNT